MAQLTNEDFARVKALGFLRNRGTENFSGRIVPEGTVFTADQMLAVSECAKRFGNGKIIATSRLCLELPGIPYEQIDAARAFIDQTDGLCFGGTGAKIRPVTACKGTTCIFGLYDTQALALKIHKAYYEGMGGVTLPHKFKIGVGGCPNSCMKPSLNDFGVEGRRVPPTETERLPVRFQIFVGGTWGRATRMGDRLSRLVTEDEILPMLDKTLLWFRENAYQKERLGKAIERLGFERFEADTAGDDLLLRRAEILNAPIKQRPAEI